MERSERLCAVLAEETVLCDALARVLRDEQLAIVQLRPEAIVTCLAEREGLQAELVRAAAQRRALVREIAGDLSGTAASAVDLLPLLPPPSRERVCDHLRRLRRALLETRGLERETAPVVGGSLDGVNEILRALRALAPGARYGADAEIADRHG